MLPSHMPLVPYQDNWTWHCCGFHVWKGLNKDNLSTCQQLNWCPTSDYLSCVCVCLESRFSTLSGTLHSFYVFFPPTHQEEFLSLCVDKLTEILASDFLNVPKEEMVFEAAMLWLNKCSSRKQSFEKVRFTWVHRSVCTSFVLDPISADT